MTTMQWLYTSQKKRIADLFVYGGKSVRDLAAQFHVEPAVIEQIIDVHGRSGTPGARRKLIAESLRWQAEHGRPV